MFYDGQILYDTVTLLQRQPGVRFGYKDSKHFLHCPNIHSVIGREQRQASNEPISQCFIVTVGKCRYLLDEVNNYLTLCQ